MLRTLSRDLDATGIIWFSLTGKNSFYFAELSSYFFNHMPSSTTNSIHRKTTEKKCHHGTQEHTCQHFRIHKSNIVIVHEIGKGCLVNRNFSAVGKR